MSWWNPFRQTKDSMPLVVFFEQHYRPQRLKDCKHNTMKAFRSVVGIFSKFIEGKQQQVAQLHHLSDDLVGEHIASRLKRVRQVTAQRDLEHLRAVWLLAKETGMAETELTVKKIADLQPKFLRAAGIEIKPTKKARPKKKATKKARPKKKADLPEKSGGNRFKFLRSKTLAELHRERAELLMLKPTTQQLYRQTIDRFHEYLMTRNRKTSAPVVDDLTDHSLCSFASWRLADNRARGTIEGEQTKLLALWRFACQRGYRRVWPTVKPIRVPTRIPVAWLESDLQKLFAACREIGPMGDLDGGLWWTALLRVIWDSGERVSATLAIEWAGVSIEHQTIVIPAEVRKGQTTDRLYKISEETADMLDKLPRDRSPFAHPYCIGTIYNRYNRLLERAGLPNDRRSKFHRIRRSTASHYAAAGGDAQKLLGHSSAKVTAGYLDPRIVPSHPDAVDLLPKIS